MSAGGLSYSGITNFGRVTLPSVEGWGTNMNILRDPPKSITTRRITKVGETSSITQMIGESGNRACEAIQVFARGVNPSVGVSYNNYGNGNSSGGLTGLSNPIAGCGRTAKLPYRIMDAGSVRMPVKAPSDLLPLSRLSRVWTSAHTQPGFVDYSKKKRSCLSAEKTKEVRTKTIKACIRPTATYNVQNPIAEQFKVKYVINKKLNTSATSGTRAMDITQRVVKQPTKELYARPLHATVVTKQINPQIYVNTSTLNTDKYIQNAIVNSASTNTSSKKHYTNIEDIFDLSDLPVKDIKTNNYTAPKSGSDYTNYIHDKVVLERNMPEYQATTNINDRSKYSVQTYDNDIKLSSNRPGTSFSSVVVGKKDRDTVHLI